MQPNILGLVYNAHTTATEFLEDAVVRDGLADEWVNACHLEHMLGCVRKTSQRRRRAACAALICGPLLTFHPRHAPRNYHCRKIPARQLVARLSEFEKAAWAFDMHHIRLLEFLHARRPLQSKKSPALQTLGHVAQPLGRISLADELLWWRFARDNC